MLIIFDVFYRSGDRVPLLCIDKHPTQPHLIATGGQDGVLGLWDMRQEQYPVTLLQAHDAEGMKRAIYRKKRSQDLIALDVSYIRRKHTRINSS